MAERTKRVLVPLADGAEEIETVTIVDVLRRAGLDVLVAGLKPGAAKLSRDMLIAPDTTIDRLVATDFDAIVLPGGAAGAEALRDDTRVQALLQEAWEAERLVAALCAGPIALHRAGILEGRRVTSHPSVRETLTGCDYRDERVVRDGHLVTSRGPGTAIEFALTLVEILCGQEKARAVAGPMLVHPAVDWT